MNKKQEKQKERQKTSTRELIGCKAVTDYCLQTYGHGDIVYFLVEPTNLSTLSEESVRARIYALMTVVKGMAELEFMCLNSRENFDDNKRYLRDRLQTEGQSAVRKLLEQDLAYLDQIQVQMATSREFLILVRLREEKNNEVFPYLSRIEKSLKEQGFVAKRADKADIQTILAIYFEQNVTTERFEDYDGERWVIFED